MSASSSLLQRLATGVDQLADALIVSTAVAALLLVGIAFAGDGAPDAWRDASVQIWLALAFAGFAVLMAGASLMFGWAARLHRLSRALLAGAVTLMVLTTVAIVALRYGAGVGTIGLQEGVIYLHGAMFLLGIPYALRQDAHVRVDLLYARLSPRRRAAINLLGHVLFLMPVSVLLITLSLTYVENTWRVVEGSAEVGGVPAVFVLKTLIPVAALVLFVQGIAESSKALALLLHADHAAEPEAS